MTAKNKLFLSAALIAALVVIIYWFWANSPVRAATRALNELAEKLQISGGESQIVRTGKSQRLKRTVTDPVDIKFREAGREGDWSAGNLQEAYLAAAMGATSATIELSGLEGEETGDDEVTLTGRIKANYSSGAAKRDIDRNAIWIMKKNAEGDWVIASFRETDS